MFDKRVLVLSQSPETLDGVREYLAKFGARSFGITRIAEARQAAVFADALLLFADDFAPLQSLQALSAMASKPCVVVTEEVRSFESIGDAPERDFPLVVLQRPAWGWMLLEGLRSAFARSRSGRV